MKEEEENIQGGPCDAAEEVDEIIVQYHRDVCLEVFS